MDESQELSQDSKQKLNVLISFGLEFYRVLMGCMLIVFVPQKCGGEICGFGENVLKNDALVDCLLYTSPSPRD